MTRDSVLSHIPGHPWAKNVLVLEEVGSTNTLLKAMALQGAPQGTVLIASRQTAGRGRLGRTFLSPDGVGVYLSALIRPNAGADQLMHLTCAVAVAMCDAVEAASGIRPKIKWTNDLVIGNRKLGGILTELVFADGAVSGAIIGIGINCRQKPEDFDSSIRDMATSLSMAAGREISRSRLAAEMIRALEKMSRELIPEKSRLMAQYEKDCMTIGQMIRVVRGESESYGTAVGIDSDGGLIVEYDSGITETVAFGEVSVRGMYGYV